MGIELLRQTRLAAPPGPFLFIYPAHIRVVEDHFAELIGVYRTFMRIDDLSAWFYQHTIG
jgi:hypothetical protein